MKNPVEGRTDTLAVGPWICASAPLVTVVPAAMANLHGDVGALALVGASLVSSLVLAYALKEARSRLRASSDYAGVMSTQNERFVCALNNMTHGLIMFDKDRKVEVVNDKFHQMFNLEQGLIRRGWTLMQVVQVGQSVVQERLRSAEVLEGMMAEAIDRRTSTSVDLRIGNGNVYEMRFEPMANGGSVIVVEDVTQKRLAQQDIVRRANFDGLTGLPNRTSFRESVRAAISNEREGGSSFSIHCLDLDRFKEVNDTMGHPFGDTLLVEVAKHLKFCVRGDDVVARLGGDEFVVLQFTDGNEDADSCLAERLIRRVSTPYLIDGKDAVVGLSVGISRSDPDSSVDDLMKRADMALYRAKENGRATYCVFEDAMNREYEDRRERENDLRRAIERDELTVFYQPIVDVASGRIKSFEALVRWLHPTKGMVPPDSFIRLAETTGAIVEIGDFVLRKACMDARSWPADVSVAVNLSEVQFGRGVVVDQVTRALNASGLASSRLELEVTETLAMTNPISTRQVIDRVREMGVKVALDDFGTGYSSLSYLHRLPFDKIKMDRSFVANLGTDPTAQALIRLVAQFVGTIGKAVVVEGVETDEQVSLLRDMGVTQMQGYLFAKPRAANDLSLTMDPAVTLPRKGLRLVQ